MGAGFDVVFDGAVAGFRLVGGGGGGLGEGGGGFFGGGGVVGRFVGRFVGGFLCRVFGFVLGDDLAVFLLGGAFGGGIFFFWVAVGFGGFFGAAEVGAGFFFDGADLWVFSFPLSAFFFFWVVCAAGWRREGGRRVVGRPYHVAGGIIDCS